MSSPSPFGQNEWLVEEMYRKFREDPSSVDPSWHEFLVDYSPEPTAEAQSTTGNGQPAQAPARAPAKASAPAGEAGFNIGRAATLLNNLQTYDKAFALETMCLGGDQGMAMIVERLA